MASILRSGKFLRCITGFSKYVIKTPTNTEVAICGQFQNTFASNAASNTDLNSYLGRLDQDVRRIGRISRRDIENVLEEIRAQHSATSSQSLLILRCCGNLVPEEIPEVRMSLVREIWKTLNNLNVPMDISHYNALLRVYLENEYQFVPTEFLTELQSKNIEPNRVTYQRLITRYCQQGDIDGATRILEYMREKGLPVNESVFNSLILGHSNANDMESARSILAVMKQAGLEPSVDTYSTLLCCYAQHGNIENLLQTLDNCEKREIFLLDKDLLDVVYALTVNGHGIYVDDILTKLRHSTGFNQDAVNTILRLINKGFEDVSLKILRTMPRSVRPNGQLIDAGSFMIKQMVKANRPIEKILDICRTLQNEGLNPKALLVATEAGLIKGSIQSTFQLLKEMKSAGFPIRQHYFWPLICSAKSNEIVDILTLMHKEFELYPNSETIRDYVIPNLREKNFEKIITILRDAGVSHTVAIASTAHFALISNKIEEAAAIMESNKAYYAVQLFKQPAIGALDKTQNYSAFIRIVRQIHENERNRQFSSADSNATQSEHDTTEDNVDDRAPSIQYNNFTTDTIGLIILDSCSYFRQNMVKNLENILVELINEGLSISSAYAAKISDQLGESMTPKLSECLGKLSSGELKPVPRKNITNRKRSIDSLTVDELSRFIANVDAKGENSNNLKRHLLNACFRTKDLEKTIETITKLEAEKFTISTGVWAQMIDLYAHHAKIDDALKLYEKIRKENPEFLLDNLKTIHLVDMILKEERFSDAIEFLNRNAKQPDSVDSDNSFNHTMTAWRILNSLAEKGDTEKVQCLFKTLVEGNYIIPNNVLLGPLIKVHLIRDDIERAMIAFEEICAKYKCTPWKNEMACRLIQKEDANNLQKLTDLSTNIHGEVNSLYDLVFSFIECGRIRQARKILETPGLKTRPNRIDNACERYKNEGLIEPLEGLVEATKDLNHIDRDKIYYSLLLTYCKVNDPNKGLGLWTKMQEENITPTDTFLIKLSELLEKNNLNVPFIVTKFGSNTKVSERQESKINATDTQKLNKMEKKDKQDTQSNVLLFRKAIKHDIDSALLYKSQLKPNETLSIMDMSNLIEQLVREGRLTEAMKCVEELLSKGMHPLSRIFKFFLNKVAAAGDILTLEMIGNKISSEQKKVVSFDNRLCHGFIASGKVKEYLNRLDKEISNATNSQEVISLAEQFPRGGALGILEKHPETVPDFEKIAEKYAKKNQLGPMNVLWMHLISSGNVDASKVIWEKHLSSAPRLMFQRVLQTAREQKDEKMAEIVINQLRGSNLSEGAIGNAYSCLIDIHTTNGNFEKGLETLQTAVKDVSIEHINRSALQRLKVSLSEKQMEFPFDIPEKKQKNEVSSSSSSSSDDDVTPKRPETRPMKPQQTDN